ncbi:hypothetical protein GCM10009733_032880 [Nonomuraea maheshkhaliensis]|uniref:Uncharacterized protein n=1 Tax=Nonomuraea maheshkhaliensis TaxID=419590 RepID=A0ABN2F8B5_9ACTN
MAENRWFPLDVDDELDEIQAAFIDALKEGAASWSLTPDDAEVLLPDHVAYGYRPQPGETSFGKLLVYADLLAPGLHLSLMTVGAYLDGAKIHGDRLHNHLLAFPAEPTPLAFTGSGPPAELAAITADWFDAIWRRPVVRYDWLRSGQVYAHRFLFADTGQGLIEGKVRTAALGTPDRIVHVRGEPCMPEGGKALTAAGQVTVKAFSVPVACPRRR